MFYAFTVSIDSAFGDPLGLPIETRELLGKSLSSSLDAIKSLRRSCERVEMEVIHNHLRDQ